MRPNPDHDFHVDRTLARISHLTDREAIVAHVQELGPAQQWALLRLQLRENEALLAEGEARLNERARQLAAKVLESPDELVEIVADRVEIAAARQRGDKLRATIAEVHAALAGHDAGKA